MIRFFRLTGNAAHEKIYLEIHSDRNYSAGFVYCTLPQGIGREEIKALALGAILQAADSALSNASRLPFHLPSEDPAQDRAGTWSSFFTRPRSTELIRAHYLTKDNRYLAAAIAAEDFALGANPDNLSFTTGLGVRAVRNILHHDSRLTGQEPPSGITVFGPQDFNHPDDAFPRLIRDDFLLPGAYVWPTVEGYLDIYRHPCVTEYTVQGTIGPAIYRFGYFAARKKV